MAMIGPATLACPKSRRDIDRRAETLLAGMTLSQKVGQMTQAERRHATPADVRAFHLGSVLSGGGSCPGDNRPADWLAMHDAYWAASMDGSEGGVRVPILYGVDAIHGNNNVRGATVFPHNIGLGAAGDPALMERIARATAREVLATGADWTFAPTLAVARDPRWGRCYESFSEDPGLVAAYAPRIVCGLQDSNGDGRGSGGNGSCGAGIIGPRGVVACAKHWVGDGGTIEGVDQGDTLLSEPELKRLHTMPYRPALDAGVLTVMVSLSSWNGRKCHAHRYLIEDLLKGEMGFGGVVVSDWNGIDLVASDYSQAVARSVNAGIDMFMIPARWQRFIGCLEAQVEAGVVPLDRIDDAVRRILRLKLASGLFDKPRPSARNGAGGTAFGSREHREVAREAVRKSLVLLKNRGRTLPLDAGARILVTGRNAHNRGHQCGGFTVAWQGVSGNEAIEGGTSIWEGIRALAPRAVLAEDASAADHRDFDVAVVVIGERPYAEGMGDIREPSPEDWTPGGIPGAEGGPGVLDPYGSTLELAALHPEDVATIRGLAAHGIPVVTILVSGRPLVVDAELSASAAFVAAWLPGTEGAGVADVLFGDHDFTGRLPMSWPGEMPWGNGRQGRSGRGHVLFQRGYGLRLR